MKPPTITAVQLNNLGTNDSVMASGEETKAERVIALGSIIALIALIEAHKDIVMSERAWVGPHGAELEKTARQKRARLC